MLLYFLLNLKQVVRLVELLGLPLPGIDSVELLLLPIEGESEGGLLFNHLPFHYVVERYGHLIPPKS